MKRVMITFREGGENGGPFNSHKRIINSNLNEKYEFIPLVIPKGRLGVINIRLTKYLIREIRKENPDIIHFSGLELGGFHVALACKIIGVNKSVVAIHGSTSESISYNKTFFKKRIISFLEFLTLKWTRYSYGVSEYVSSWSKVKMHGNNYFGHIYNMVSVEVDQSKRISIKEQLSIPNGTRIAVSTGRIVTEKGYDILTDVIKRDVNENLVYVIVGDGDYLPEMKKRLKKEIENRKVYFLGYREDVLDILSECDLCVMATLHETLCMSLAEAAFMGLALVASNVGGIPEIIVEGYNGYLIEKGNVLEFNNKINEIVTDKELLAKMKVNSKIHAKEKFSNLTIESQLEKLYEGIK
ncbi:glycosyltransferase family 4 protein [Bacillaceae bacterium S4-13-56]